MLCSLKNLNSTESCWVYKNGKRSFLMLRMLAAFSVFNIESVMHWLNY